jgi:hypothetical protein
MNAVVKIEEKSVFLWMESESEHETERKQTTDGLRDEDIAAILPRHDIFKRTTTLREWNEDLNS